MDYRKVNLAESISLPAEQQTFPDSAKRHPAHAESAATGKIEEYKTKTPPAGKLGSRGHGASEG